MYSRFLITGTSGFVGSRLAKKLLNEGYKIWGIDRLQKSENIDSNNYKHIQLDITDKDADKEISRILIENQIQMVIHLAALIKVGESQEEPEKYWKVNFQGTKMILLALKAAGLNKLIFASTAAVYKSINSGDIQKLAIKEDSPLIPESVYGKTKLAAENLIQTYVDNYDFQTVIFRFFNVAGGKEIHKPSIHLIPIIIERIMEGKEIRIFGNDYPTLDGTCYRDYFHVDDLIEAICLSIKNWNASKRSFKVYNLGSEKGYSVLEVVKKVFSLVDKEPCFEISSRRSGDPPVLLADSQKINKELGWKSKKSLEEIILDTLNEMTN